MGWHLKPRHVVVDEGNFLFAVFLGRKLMFENILTIRKICLNSKPQNVHAIYERIM